jgi:hypothetical protein
VRSVSKVKVKVNIRGERNRDSEVVYRLGVKS